MRIRNPLTVGPLSPRIYRGVQRISTSSAPRSSDRVWGGGGGGPGGWWGGGCRGWSCNAWPWYAGVVPIAAPVYGVPVDLSCPVPIVNGYLVVDGRWATNCFWPAYAQARAQWGRNPGSVAQEVLLQLAPNTSLDSANGAEAELLRRIEHAVAVLFNADGIPTKYPRRSILPRPARANDIAVPWIRVLVTGWT